MAILNLNGALNFNKLVEKALDGKDYSTISSYNRDHADGPLKLLIAVVLLLVLAQVIFQALTPVKKSPGPDFDRIGRSDRGGYDDRFGGARRNNRERGGNYRRQ